MITPKFHGVNNFAKKRLEARKKARGAEKRREARRKGARRGEMARGAKLDYLSAFH